VSELKQPPLPPSAVAQQNPDWNWDEDALAMDLYVSKGLHWGGTLPGPTDKDVVALSDLLQTLPFHEQRATNFRNPDGVARKLSNFRSVQVPGTGSANHSAMDARVWGQFKDDLSRLNSIAQAIRTNGPLMRRHDFDNDDADEAGFSEGRLLLALHKRRERNPKLVARKKALALERIGTLQCEACGFDFGQRYGEYGAGIIECHHLVPLAEDVATRHTRLSDLALLCANCHRVVHRRPSVLTLDQVRIALRDLPHDHS
jgi:5-methylcytosine-specific restriction protein A